MSLLDFCGKEIILCCVGLLLHSFNEGPSLHLMGRRILQS
jgi:hypothetical protein